MAMSSQMQKWTERGRQGDSLRAHHYCQGARRTDSAFQQRIDLNASIGANWHPVKLSGNGIGNAVVAIDLETQDDPGIRRIDCSTGLILVEPP